MIKISPKLIVSALGLVSIYSLSSAFAGTVNISKDRRSKERFLSLSSERASVISDGFQSGLKVEGPGPLVKERTENARKACLHVLREDFNGELTYETEVIYAPMNAVEIVKSHEISSEFK